MVSAESIQNLAENGGEMGDTAQYVKRLAEQGGDFNGNASYTDLWLKMTMKATVEIFGNDRITRIEMWNQETKQWISFLLSDLRSDAAVFFPTAGVAADVKTTEKIDDESDLGGKKTSSETKVEQDLTNSGEKSTEVETMSYERLAEAVDKQKAADDVEADCEKEKGDVSKASEQNVLDKSEADDVETEDKRVQPIHYNGNGGVQAARRRAENIMFHHNLSCLVDSVVGYLVLREEYRKPAKEFLVDFSNKWFESLDSHMQTSECVSAANGWEDCCWAYKDVYLELAEGVGTFKQKYFEDDSGLPLTYKKMVGWMCKGFYITCTEMSSMCNGFAYAEENDRWKSWESSDEYLDLLTLRGRAGSQVMSISKC